MNILHFADDTVIFTSEKDNNIIEEILNIEFSYITQWLTNNNLFLRLKKIETAVVWKRH